MPPSNKPVNLDSAAIFGLSRTRKTMRLPPNNALMNDKHTHTKQNEKNYVSKYCFCFQLCISMKIGWLEIETNTK